MLLSRSVTGLSTTISHKHYQPTKQVSIMSNVISFAKASSEAKVESEFVKLLDRETRIDGNVRPLPQSLLSRMDALKAKADSARARAEILEG